MKQKSQTKEQLEKERRALLKNGEGGFSLVPKSLEEAMKFAEMMAASDMVPKDYKGKAGNILIAVQMGQEVGLKPMAAIQNIATINGRPSIWGDAAKAIVIARPECEAFEEEDEVQIAKTGSATCRIKRRGKGWSVSTFTKEDADRAGLTTKGGDMYKKYWPRMYKMRARGFSMRDSFPDALKGLFITEELIGVKPEPIAEPQEINIEPEDANQDSGNGSATATEPALEKPEEEKTQEEQLGFISEPQRQELYGLIQKNKIGEIIIRAWIRDKYKIETIEELPKEQFAYFKNWINSKAHQDASK